MPSALSQRFRRRDMSVIRPEGCRQHWVSDFAIGTCQPCHGWMLRSHSLRFVHQRFVYIYSFICDSFTSVHSTSDTFDSDSFNGLSLSYTSDDLKVKTIRSVRFIRFICFHSFSFVFIHRFHRFIVFIVFIVFIRSFGSVHSTSDTFNSDSFNGLNLS